MPQVIVDTTDPGVPGGVFALHSLWKELQRLENLAEQLDQPVAAHLLGMAVLDVEDSLARGAAE